MSGILIVIIVKLLDPVNIVLGLVAGYLSRTMLVLAGAAAAIALLEELILGALQVSRGFNPASFAMGFASATLWGCITFWLTRRKA